MKLSILVVCFSFYCFSGTLSAQAVDDGFTPVKPAQPNANKGPKLLPSPTDVIPVVKIEIKNSRPLWSPDGKKIAFAKCRTPGGNVCEYQVCVIDADGSNYKPISTLSSPDNFCWSPDGKKLAFIGGKDRNICISNPDGTSMEEVTNQAEELSRSTIDYPSWSPDGTKIAFERGNQVWIIAVDGSTWFKLCDGARPSWFPGGKRIAFVKKNHDNAVVHEVCAIDVDGKNPQVLMPERPSRGLTDMEAYIVENLTVSPDAQKVYCSIREWNNEKSSSIFYVKTDGSEAINLTGHHRDPEALPSLSPDGKFLAFIKGSNLWRMDLASSSGADDGKPFHRLTPNDKSLRTLRPQTAILTKQKEAKQDGPLSWSPDGKMIAYAQDGEIWVTDSKGSSQVQITSAKNNALELAQKKQTDEPIFIMQAPRK